MDSIPRTSGIYKIVCVPTGKVYIGSSVNLQARWRGHWNRLSRKAHRNQHLQNAWNKYGETAFEFCVIELVLSAFLVEREQFWIDKTRAFDRKYGFNARALADSNFGLVRSPEQRARLSIAFRGRKRGPMAEATRKAISAAKQGKRYRPHSIEARENKSKRQQGHSVSDQTRAKIGAANRGRPPSDATKAAHFEKLSKTYLIIDPDGNRQIVKGLGRFCREHGLIDVSMANVAKGKQRQHKGWKCYRIEDIDAVSDPSVTDSRCSG